MTRAMKGAVAAGFTEPRIVIHPDGTIEIITGDQRAIPIHDEGEPFDL